MIFLVDHNLEEHALLLSGNIASIGWLELLPIQFMTFEEIKLEVSSNDLDDYRGVMRLFIP
jgi:hypothetical protein